MSKDRNYYAGPDTSELMGLGPDFVLQNGRGESYVLASDYEIACFQRDTVMELLKDANRALTGVVRVADRATQEFDLARNVLFRIRKFKETIDEKEIDASDGARPPDASHNETTQEED